MDLRWTVRRVGEVADVGEEEEEELPRKRMEEEEEEEAGLEECREGRGASAERKSGA
jgi:hypothetical protein